MYLKLGLKLQTRGRFTSDYMTFGDVDVIVITKNNNICTVCGNIIY